MKDFVIVLPTHSSYCGVVKNFLQLLGKNWPDCPFDIVVSVVGDDVKIDGVDNLYNGKDASLIDCVVNVVKKYKRKYYISFLGDAFINMKIDNTEIVEMLKSLADSNIEYCSLQCVKNYRKEKKFNDYFRHINNLDRYSHNFTVFVASRGFIMGEMARFKTDLDFEKNYLCRKDDFYFDRHLIVRKNYFNLLPSITKGKWDRINYRKLKKDNPEVEFDARDVQSWKESILCHTRSRVVAFLPSSVRVGLKKITERVFDVKFGVEG